MNHILHNISLIILSFGIILMVIYVTKSQSIKHPSSRGFTEKVEDNETMNEIDAAYAERASKKFKGMFDDNSAWLSKYQAIDNVQQGKLFY